VPVRPEDRKVRAARRPALCQRQLHIGHALNKILKDMVVTRSQPDDGPIRNYVPGWDCHGLPIEWKIEEQYRAKGKDKDDVDDRSSSARECRAFAEHWIDVQREEFKRLGVIGDWDNPTDDGLPRRGVIAARVLASSLMNGGSSIAARSR
jgi:isoleucyl-tRNA synthetase